MAHYFTVKVMTHFNSETVCYTEFLQKSVVSRGFMIYSSGSENLLILMNPSQYRSEFNKME